MMKHRKPLYVYVPTFFFFSFTIFFFYIGLLSNRSGVFCYNEIIGYLSVVGYSNILLIRSGATMLRDDLFILEEIDACLLPARKYSANCEVISNYIHVVETCGSTSPANCKGAVQYSFGSVLLKFYSLIFSTSLIK